MKYKDPITGEYKELFLKASDTLPIGTIVPYGSNDIPANWLLCDGRAVSRTTYANLFSVIGTNFGEGDGTTTFNLPDFRGKVPEQVVNYIIKSAMSVGVIGSVLNNKSDSNKDTYSCNYINNQCGKLLWTNPNPTSAFGNQTITLSSDNYDVLEVYYTNPVMGTIHTDKILSTKFIKGYGGVLNFAGHGSSGGTQYNMNFMRAINRIDDISYSIDSCIYYWGSNSMENNNFLIPMFIIGYKTGLFETDSGTNN